ncbi:uncharacterized protein LOC114317181 isoform X1 [Camellia sinensis]|uniref:uncharacterized protein LOC114317181 isoform X1 n=1 Tax=Camellia sinensis TaxID=4442 RepID=UPI001036EB3C|nr:uncharacterized protein LOC114317181 isoform X1 [Camellia sinensis]
MAKSSPVSALKAYWFPLILFASSMFYQLLILPRSYPPSHYDVLGIKRYSSMEQVTEAYEKFSSKWNSGTEVPPITEFIKIRYAFELLTNPLWKRNYDIFGIDEHIHVLDSIKERHAGTIFSEIDLPLLESASFDPGDHDFEVITSGNFLSKFENSKALLIQNLVQVFSFGSDRSAQFYNNWKKIASLLDGMANTGMVELGEVQLATYLAEKTFTGQPSFQNGLPSLIAFPSGCNTANCLVRYEGELSVDAVTNWFATTILSLPRILYYSKDSLLQSFVGKSSPHKVKVIFFSETGERAAPFVRQAALSYWPYAAFAFVPWREEESSFWWNVFGVESAPAIVFLKEHGVKPVVYHGPANNSWFVDIMEQHKHQELPQLRSVTSMELGCDARGYSRAGNETAIWYCVILVGRSSPELNKMRATVRRIQEALSTVDKDQPSSLAAVALKEKRLTFTWLDGEAQQRYCFFHTQTENSYDTCGPRRDITDVPQLIIVRYKRNATEDSIKNEEKKPKNMLEAFLNDDVDPASQLVARYNGSEESSKIIKWISQIIEDGDSGELPFFRAKTPALVPEDADPIWSVGAKNILSKGTGMKQRIGSIMNGIHNRLGDPRIGPVLLLGALLSFGSIWLRRSQSTHPSQSNNQTQPSKKDDEDRPNQRRKKRAVSDQDRPPSITDTEPIDAYQMPLSDSDSE